MFKIDLPPDSSWDWEVRTYGEPLPTGRYVLVEDYNKLKKVTSKLIETGKKLKAEYDNHLNLLEKKNKYQELYIQYLTGGMSKEEFKKLAINFAEPLVIDRNSKEPENA